MLTFLFALHGFQVSPVSRLHPAYQQMLVSTDCRAYMELLLQRGSSLQNQVNLTLNLVIRMSWDAVTLTAWWHSSKPRRVVLHAPYTKNRYDMFGSEIESRRA